MSKISQICILSDVKYIPLATGYLAALCKIIGFQEKDIIRMSVSLEESLVSTIKNAFPGDNSKEINIVFEVDEMNFCIAIRNKGLPYVIEDSEVDLHEMDEKSSDALSVMLIRGMVDRFIHQSLGLDGQEIRLVKYLEQSVDFSADSAQEPADQPIEECSFEFRAAKKEELIQIIRCIYDEYSYSYPNDSFYYNERLTAMVEAGSVYPFVCVTDKGEVVATTTLTRVDGFPMLLETSAWVVKRRYRKHSLMKTLLPYQLERSTELNTNGVFVECVTHHPATQKVVSRYGFTPMAFSFHSIPEEMETSFDLPEHFRISLALAVKYYNTPSNIDIYPPAIHRSFIKDRYDSISAQVNFRDSDFVATEPLTAITTEYSVLRQLGVIRITSVGLDIDKAIRSAIARLRSQKAETGTLYIDMSNPSCPYIFESAIRNGFIFSGVLPNTGNGELMVMNHSMGKAIDYDRIVTTEEFGELLNYIKQHDQTRV